MSKEHTDGIRHHLGHLTNHVARVGAQGVVPAHEVARAVDAISEHVTHLETQASDHHDKAGGTPKAKHEYRPDPRFKRGNWPKERAVTYLGPQKKAA